MPIRIQLSRKAGWRMPPNTVRVCRPGKFGNPFRVGDPHPKHGRPLTQAEAVALFETETRVPFRRSKLEFTGADVIGLRGKDLACWCKPGAPCHADVLLKAANAEISEPAGADNGNEKQGGLGRSKGSPASTG